MNKIVFLIINYMFVLSATSVYTISVSLASDVNTYMQVYDSFGAIIFAGLIFPDKVQKIDTGIIQLDRVRWLGTDKIVYEYRFEKYSVTDRIVFQTSKNNTCMVGKIGQNGMIESPFSYNGNVIYGNK